MKRAMFVFSVLAALFLGGCTENPVTPPEPPASPTVADVDARAKTLHDEGKDVLTAAGLLKSEFPFGPDTLTAGLFSAGYPTEDLIAALKTVFHILPRVCEKIIIKIEVQLPPDQVAEFVICIYTDTLAQRVDDLIYFLEKLQSLEKSVRFLDSLYRYSPQDIVSFLHAFEPNITAIVQAVHNRFPNVTEKEFASILQRLKVAALEAAQAFRAVWQKSATETATLFKDAGYGLEEVIRAVRAVYQLKASQLASILNQMKYQMADAMRIINSAGCTLNELAEALKNFYNQNSPQAAAILKQYAANLISLGSALKSQYLLSDIDIAVIVKNLGYGDLEILVMLKGLGDSAPDAVSVLRAVSAHSQTEIAGLLRDAGYLIADALAGIRTSFGSSYPRLAAILDTLGYSIGPVTETLKAIGCGYDEIAGILSDHYRLTAAQAAEYLWQIKADFATIANALKNHFNVSFADIELILKNLGAQLTDIVPILQGWKESIANIIADLTSIGFSQCDVLHYFNLPC